MAGYRYAVWVVNYFSIDRIAPVYARQSRRGIAYSVIMIVLPG
jgi:hypothetical protein